MERPVKLPENPTEPKNLPYNFSSSTTSTASDLATACHRGAQEADDDNDEEGWSSGLVADVNSPIWIDALCINQDDAAERASQVQLMGRVFQDASCVFAWLGPPDSFY